MLVNENTNDARILSMSRNVSGHSSNCPSSIFSRTRRSTMSVILPGVGFSMDRDAASTVSASIKIACSRVLGRGPS